MKRFSIFILITLLLSSSLLFGQVGKQQQVAISQKITSGGGVDFVNDTFTESSDMLLAAHTGELGATWTEHPDATYGDIMNVDAASDRIFPTSNPSAFYASGVPPNANYKVCGVVFAHTNVGVNIAACGRMDTTANTMYCIRYNSGTTWELRKILSGVQSTLTSSTNQLITLGTSKTGCVVMNGTTISMTVEGTTEGTPTTDSDITGAGRAGVRSAGGSTATTGFHLSSITATSL